MPDQSAAKKRSNKTGHPYQHGLFPFGFKDRWLKFGAGQEGENNGAGSGKKSDPLGAGEQPTRAHERSNNELCHGADDDLGKSGCDFKPDRQQGCHERETHPES